MKIFLFAIMLFTFGVAYDDYRNDDTIILVPKKKHYKKDRYDYYNDDRRQSFYDDEYNGDINSRFDTYIVIKEPFRDSGYKRRDYLRDFRDSGDYELRDEPEMVIKIR